MATDLLTESNPIVVVPALQLFLTCMYTMNPGEVEGNEDDPDAMANPEMLMQAMERMSILFDCVRRRGPEEAGLLCTTRSTDQEERDEWRAVAQKGASNFYQILSSEGLELAVHDLVYMAYWRTPEGRPRRYDTRFFAVRCPRDQVASCDGHETTDDFWITPAQALANFHRGEWSLLLPTRTLLAQLAPFTSIDEAFGHWVSTAVTMVQPVDAVINGERVALLPDVH